MEVEFKFDLWLNPENGEMLMMHEDDPDVPKTGYVNLGPMIDLAYPSQLNLVKECFCWVKYGESYDQHNFPTYYKRKHGK